ncbi:MAG: hypothetical protein QW186_07480 [Candidatus Bathyarchaeia archaeon]
MKQGIEMPLISHNMDLAAEKPLATSRAAQYVKNLEGKMKYDAKAIITPHKP